MMSFLPPPAETRPSERVPLSTLALNAVTGLIIWSFLYGAVIWCTIWLAGLPDIGWSRSVGLGLAWTVWTTLHRTQSLIAQRASGQR